MQNSVSYSIIDVNITTFIRQKSLQIHLKRNKINDHSYNMFSKSQSKIFIVEKLHNLKETK